MKIWDLVKEDFEPTNMKEDWKKNVIAGAMAASSMLGGKAQSFKQPEPTSISTIQSKGLDTNTLSEWNNYIYWLKSKGLSGSKKMNHVAFSKQTLAEYNKEHPESNLTYSLVSPIQAQIKKYRQSVINYAKNGNPIKFTSSIKPDFSNFMSWALGTSEDGINGEYTSQFIFPKKYLTDLNTNYTADLGYAVAPE
jgi:hypothetical protein